ncbi:MAG TPA: cobyrinic acid a,c-diamide synthase [Nitrospiraceae bacterium]|nr:cobyrinic acid a,c-diamide synthase [Nitrospiraceae bacterium]
MQAVPRLVLSAMRGGSGKTTLAIGITAAWRKRGRNVAVFKKGPDFIDAGWLGAAAGRQCYNLDPFLMEEEVIRRSFARHTARAGAAVIEGNRGLYDGVDESGTYSTARLAKLLKAPVVLIADCTKATGTVAALVLGCQQYDRATDIGGVILNNVSPGRHEKVVRNAIEQTSGLPVVGAVPRLGHGEFPERHMGLTPHHEHPDVDTAIQAATSVAEQYLDTDGLWNIANNAPRWEVADLPADAGHAEPEVTIGVIQDSAFQFYYPDNLEALEHQGARIIPINALKDRDLLDIDALYIGGGFPETQAAELAANEGFGRSLRAAVDEGLPVYAECGGLIYLGRSLVTGQKTYPMTGVLPLDFVLEGKPQAHGYTVLEVEKQTPFFDAGVTLRGHEFHYSHIVNLDELPDSAFRMKRGRGLDGKVDGIIYKNVLAAYTHVHALGTPEWARGMVNKARSNKERKRRDRA